MVYLPSEYREVPPVDLLSWLFDNTGVDVEKDILIDAANHQSRLNSQQTISLIHKLIAGFRAVGLKPGDCVLVHAFNHILYPILYFGIIGSGGIFVGSNPSYKVTELSHLISIAQPKYAIIEAGLLTKISTALEASISAEQIFVFDPNAGQTIQKELKCWTSLLQYGEQDWIRFNEEAIAKSTIAVLQSTSGTTGLPKVAATSHYALVAAGVAMQCSKPKPYAVSQLISLPLFHSFGASFVQNSAFQSGEPTYVMRRFDAEIFTSLVDRFNVTEIAVVPTMVASIVNQRTSPLVLKTLRRIWCAGSSFSPILSDAMYDILHEDACISQVWGMTEFGRITSTPWARGTMDGSVGELMPNTEARVMDSHGLEILDEGVAGELQVRGPSTMNGYSRFHDATTGVSTADWLRTGDLGCIKRGNVFILGRMKELIKVRGWQVSPTELEQTLLLHESILDAAVIGVRFPTREVDGELPRAYVVIREGGFGIDEQEVQRFVRDRLASFKALDGGVVFVETIQRNAYGKIMRQPLMERAMAEITTNITEARI